MTTTKRLSAWPVMTVLVFLLALPGCAGMQPGYQEPEVYLTRLAPLSGNGMEQRFLVGLRIVNPNRGAINIAGLSYGVSVQGQKLVSGVSSDIPRIPGYGESEVTLEAATNLLGAVRLVSELLTKPAEAINYELEARLDVGRFALPITIKETGAIKLGSAVSGN
ncbi:MAG: LEA type 2 family protein [Porticoccaceae bacterium]